MVPNPDALSIPIFGDQTGNLHKVLELDISEIAVVTIQEDAHGTATIVDNESILTYLGCDCAGDRPLVSVRRMAGWM